MTPIIKELQYTYKKPKTNVWVLNFEDIPVDKGLIRDQQIVHLAPQSIGGNHIHPRTEWFTGLGNLDFVWTDEKGKKHTEKMNPKGQLKLITVPPFLPHAVVNRSKSMIGILFEMADGKMKDVTPVEVI